MQDFILAQGEQIAELCRMHHVRRLSIFGSAARDDLDPSTSDVDIIVDFDLNEIPTGTHSDNKWTFHDELVRSFGRTVDLLTWESIRNKYLLREIQQSHETLYAA
jgi:predicted nucleotidyltransferase